MFEIKACEVSEKSVPMAIGMSFLETSVTKRSDIMDRL
jgi:hypothetical protein